MRVEIDVATEYGYPYLWIPLCDSLIKIEMRFSHVWAEA
jgi:hypothetical protein